MFRGISSGSPHYLEEKRSVRRKRIAYTAIALLAFASMEATAQQQQAGSIMGVVVDSATGEPVAVAHVQVPLRRRAEFTEEDGTFELGRLAPGKYRIVVERLGYRTAEQTVSIDPGATAHLRIALVSSAVSVAPVVVTGTLGRRSGQDALSPTAVLSGAKLDRRADVTIAATIRDQPGVSMTSVGPSTGRPVVRGLAGDRILVLEDGQRPGDMSSIGGDHALAIEPLTAKQIEVVRGPMSLMYGSSALGGVVNVVREEIPTTYPEHPHGNFSAQGSSVNRGASGGGYLNLPVGPLASRVELSGRASGDVRTPVGDLRNTGAQTLNGAFALSRIGEWGHAGGSYRYYDNVYGIPGGFVGGHESGVDVDMRRHTLRGEVDLMEPLRGFENVRATVGFTSYDHLEREIGDDHDHGHGEEGHEHEEHEDVSTRFGQKLLSGEVVGRHRQLGPFALGAIGVRAQYRDINTGGSLQTPSTADYSIAAFVIEEIGTGPTRVQLGARYDLARYEPSDTGATIFVGGRFVPLRAREFGSFSGSIGVLHELANGIRVGMSASRAYRTPDFNELYTNGPHLAANSFDVGDPSLTQETGLGLDGFVRVQRDAFSLEAAAFMMRLADYIYPSSRGRVELGAEGGRPRFQYTNEDAQFVGAEGEASWAFAPSWAIEGTLSYVQAKFTNTRDSIPVFTIEGDTTFMAASKYPPLIPPLNGQVAVRYDEQRVFGGAGVRFAAAQDRLGDFESTTDAYALLSFDAGIRLLRGARLHTLTLRVDNVLNTEYRDHLSRIKDIMPEPGRNISLLYRLTF